VASAVDLGKLGAVGGGLQEASLVDSGGRHCLVGYHWIGECFVAEQLGGVETKCVLPQTVLCCRMHLSK
jgi:hypothetical protein